MYLASGRSSRFKLLKIRVLALNLARTVKLPRSEPSAEGPPGDAERKPAKRPRYTDTSHSGDSSTFVSDFYEFADILSERLLRSLESNGFVRLTPIQRAAIPKVLDGSTALIRSPSGTGKTLTFLVPALQRLVAPPGGVKITRADGTKVRAHTSLGAHHNAHQGTLVPDFKRGGGPGEAVPLGRGIMHQRYGRPQRAGGENRKSEKARIRKGITLVTGTPGRILDHMEATAAFNLSNLDMLVLDEADRLLDMGFEGKIRTIHGHLLDAKVSNAENAGIQLVLTSATITERVTRLVESCFVAKPAVIGVDQGGRSQRSAARPVPSKLALEFVLVDCANKFMCLVAMLLRFLKNREKVRFAETQILVFVANCDTVIYVEALLKALTWPALRRPDTAAEPTQASPRGSDRVIRAQILKLHGDMEAKDRIAAMDQFVKSENAVLVSTDVASRGLNLSRVSRVVQYDPPQQLDEFVHRSGRTARIGESGACALVLIRHERGLVELLRARGMGPAELSEAALWAELRTDHAPKHLKKFKGDLVAFTRNCFCAQVKADAELAELATRAYRASIRSYKTYAKDLRRVFDFRQLHLGHYATAFCLSMKPTEIIRRPGAPGARKKKSQAKPHSDRRAKEPRTALSAESQAAAARALSYMRENKMVL